ncbi:MAG TPA: PglZ domain-containing protein [Tepidimicrobium sp.]|nr:PglZ domain-containing protein [Tepidimicrobium sp.]
MFFNYLSELCGFGIYGKIAIFDFQKIIGDDHLSNISGEFGYKLIYYDDVERFRYIYETEIKESKDRYLVVLRSDIYFPYDIRSEFHCKDIDYGQLFPKLNTYALENTSIFDLDLLYIAHENLYSTIDLESKTKGFLLEDMFNMENIEEYRGYLINRIKGLLDKGDYSAWQDIALLYSKMQYIKYRCNLEGNKELEDRIQNEFQKFILKNYSKLSGYSAYHGPVLINKGLDYIFMNSKKPALIVMDGMSILDWLILSEDLRRISYKYNSTYAIIPTITPISRQSLLSGKLPIEMERPFSLAQEKSMFIEKCKENGYREDQIKYNRGYDFKIHSTDQCICTIINDIDDLIHSQRQGNIGMFNDVKLLSNSKKLYELIKRLHEKDFDIYIASDHGHRETETIGSPRGVGVELETKSKRTLILKDFADYEKMIDEFDMIEYPPYFLPKDYKYLLCEHDKSIGVKGDISLSHGGISIEEAIVPFIKVEGVDV